MKREAAKEHALGYAAGREDGSGVPTAQPDQRSGFIAFAEAFADGWDEYNQERRGMLTNARSAYERWQATGGQTIWDEHERPAKPATV